MNYGSGLRAYIAIQQQYKRRAAKDRRCREVTSQAVADVCVVNPSRSVKYKP